MSPVEPIPVVPAAGTVINHPLRLIGGLDACRLQLRGRCRQHAGTDGKGGGVVLTGSRLRFSICLREVVNHVGESEKRLFKAHHRASRLPLAAVLHGLRVAPEAGKFVRVERIVNVHPPHRLRVVRREGEERHAIGGLEIQRELRCARQLECALQMFLEPKILGDGVLVGVAMVQVRRDAEAHAVVGQVAPVLGHVVNVGVEIVRGRQPGNRADSR